MNHTLFTPYLNRGFSVFCAFIMILALLLMPESAFARKKKGPIVIRDTEIENIIKSWATPVIKAAELNPAVIKIILVQDPNINAFVAGGPNIFIYTGLISRSESPDEIIGVMAHELGHIRGGHLVRGHGALQNASYQSLLGTLLGLGAAVLTGEGGLATAIISGTQTMAQRKFLAFSRVQESSADQAALRYMEKAKMDPAGLVSFMKKLESEELLPATQQSQYVRTHPLTRDRVEALMAGRERSTYKSKGNKVLQKMQREQYNRIRAKLTGFITPEQVSWKYNDRDTSIEANYARTIASYRQNETKKALEQMENLLTQESDNPYFWELKGQILMDFGKVEESLPPYRRAVELLPTAPLIRTAYAHALIESTVKDKKRLNLAVTQLQRALKEEPRSAYIHRLLATAYGRLDKEYRAKLHLAEEALLKNQMPYAKRQALLALAGLKEGSNPWLRAQDILNFIEQRKKNH